MPRASISIVAAGFSLLIGGAACLGADKGPVPDPVLKEWTSDSVVFSAPEKHHFNLDAPNKAYRPASGASKEKSPLPLSMKDHEAKVKTSGLQPGERVHADLFLCDDAKTFCVKKPVEAEVPAKAPKKKTLNPG